MKRLLLVILVLAACWQAEARTVEEHILARYAMVLDKLRTRGFDGPFGEQVARFAMMRQLVEDGLNRGHSVSIVGMVPGGMNKEIMSHLGLALGQTNHNDLTLKTVGAHDGQRSYAIYGPRADVASTVAIALLWDKYVHELPCFKKDEIRAWNQSKVISQKLAKREATEDAALIFRTGVAEDGKKVLEKANRLYSPTAAGHIQRMVRDMEPIFELVTPPARIP
ncbi:MAG: hypothetical protein FJ118_02345 [Deltaproteobacteria bacterium]|nr:hypothetical protein [Deltaproteobacteria bacterium]